MMLHNAQTASLGSPQGRVQGPLPSAGQPSMPLVLATLHESPMSLQGGCGFCMLPQHVVIAYAWYETYV